MIFEGKRKCSRNGCIVVSLYYYLYNNWFKSDKVTYWPIVRTFVKVKKLFANTFIFFVKILSPAIANIFKPFWPVSSLFVRALFMFNGTHNDKLVSSCLMTRVDFLFKIIMIMTKNLNFEFRKKYQIAICDIKNILKFNWSYRIRYILLLNWVN